MNYYISRICIRQYAKLAIFLPIKIRFITFIAKKRIKPHQEYADVCTKIIFTLQENCR